MWVRRLGELCGPQHVEREEVIPAWRRQREGRPPEEAVLDVVLRLPGRPALALDTAVVEAACDSMVDGRGALRPGAAARCIEATKHRRYPLHPAAPVLVPIIYEAGGRAGEEAERFLKLLCADMCVDDETRIATIRSIRQSTAVALMRGNAQMLLGPGPPVGGWPWCPQQGV